MDALDGTPPGFARVILDDILNGGTMPQEHKLRAAVIGCGAIGTRHAAAIRQSDHAELVAVCGDMMTRCNCA